MQINADMEGGEEGGADSRSGGDDVRWEEVRCREEMR